MPRALTHPGVFQPSYTEDGRRQSYRYFNPGAESEPDIALTRDADGTARASVPHRFIVHSPSGFEWGYGGSGPAELALNILGRFVPAPEAWRLHHDYKFDVIAHLARDRDHIVTAESVVAWINRRWQEADND